MDAMIMQDLNNQQPRSAYETQYSAQQDPCLIGRVAYDIGSNSTKMMGAIVNVCNMTIRDVFSKETYPVLYRQDLQDSYTYEFSDWIKEYGLQTLKTAKVQAEYDYLKIADSTATMQHCAVATAAFREATNGEAFAKELTQYLQIPIVLISQEDEGKLAYISALAQLGSQPLRPIVWDIGGGSMQLTYKNESGEFIVMGNNVASHQFQKMVAETITNRAPHESPNPMTHDHTREAIALAQHLLTFEDLSQSVFKSRIEQGTPVIAVGQVHNVVVKPWINQISTTQDNTFSKEQLANAIAYLENKTDDEIIGMMLEPDREQVKNQLTNLILVYATMEKLGINQVQTVETSNAQGLLLKGC